MTVDGYLALVTSEHRDKPKFTALVAALAAYQVDVQAAIDGIPAKFDLDVAVGVQLDAVGEWVGRSRRVPIPRNNIWFSFDTSGKGFDSGIWKAPYDSGFGTAVLDDETYRTFLRAKIMANNWDGTAQGAQAAYNMLFSKQSNLLVFVCDNCDGSMTVGISGDIPSLIYLALIEENFLPLRPAGVHGDIRVLSVNFGDLVLDAGGHLVLDVGRTEGVIIGNLELDQSSRSLFGFDLNNRYIGGFDTGCFGVHPEYYTT